MFSIADGETVGDDGPHPIRVKTLAQMFPCEIPLDVKTTESERDLFSALKNGLSDDYFVYFAMPFIEPTHAEQGEVDFIILHPEKGMLFLECKGKGVERDLDGTWYRHKGKKRERLKQTPIEQVKKQLEALVTKFRSPCARLVGPVHGRFPMVYGWALAFPFTSWPASEIPPDVEPEVFLDAQILQNTQAMVDGAFAFWHRGHDGIPPRLTPAEFEVFRTQVLSPEFRLVPNLGGALASERTAFIRLSTEQEFLARMFIANRRIMVSGGAGTGKTLLALHCARLLANQGKRVLLLCFNRALADHLHQTIEDAPPAAGQVEAVNFHRLCSQAGYALDQPFESLPKKITSKTDFWVNQAPKTLWEAIAHKKIGPWDAIIVDEGQDFAPDWWEILACGITENGYMAVFYDESQSLFEHGGGLPDLGPIMPLDQNFRNTQAIATVLNKLVPSRTTSHPRCPTGESPTVIQQESAAWTRRKLAEIIHNLVSVHGVKYHQMTILTPRTPVNSVLEDATDLDGIPIVHQVNLREQGVFHTSISGFKGLESDIVFMLDIDPEHERCSNRARYVGASRACHRLFVFEKGDWLD